MSGSVRSERLYRLPLALFLAIVCLSVGAPGFPARAIGDEPSVAAAETTVEDARQQEPKSEEAHADSEDENAAESQEPAVDASQDDEDASVADDDATSDEVDSEKNGKPKKAEQTTAAKRDKVRLALLTLKEAMPETSAQLGPFGEMQLDLREAVTRLEKAAKDKSIAGIVLDIQNPMIGRGKVDELRGAIARFRAAGKKAYAMLETATPADYLIACACDEIVMPETGIVLLPGIHAEATFYKGLLAKLGIEADFIHMGEYKGAGEPFTREKFSEPVRENLTTVIDGLYDDLVTTIVKDRPLSIAQTREIIDTGLLTARKAKELGLIDRIAYVETLRDELAEAYDADPLVFVQNYGQK
jgi:protease-4